MSGATAPQAGMKWSCKHCCVEIPDVKFAFDYCPTCGKKQPKETEAEKVGNQHKSQPQKSFCIKCKEELITPTANTCLKCDTVQNPSLQLRIPTVEKETTSHIPSSNLELPSNTEHLDHESSELTRKSLRGGRKRSGSLSSIDSSNKKVSDASKSTVRVSVPPFRSPQLKQRSGSSESDQPPANQPSEVVQTESGTKRSQASTSLGDTSPPSSPHSKRPKKSTEGSEPPFNEQNQKPEYNGSQVENHPLQDDGTNQQEGTNQLSDDSGTKNRNDDFKLKDNDSHESWGNIIEKDSTSGDQREQVCAGWFHTRLGISPVQLKFPHPRNSTPFSVTSLRSQKFTCIMNGGYGALLEPLYSLLSLFMALSCYFSFSQYFLRRSLTCLIFLLYFFLAAG